MRGLLVAVLVAALSVGLTADAAPAVAASAQVRQSEVYRAKLPLNKRSRATISVEHFHSAGTYYGTNAQPNAFYGCVTVEGAPRKYTYRYPGYTYSYWYRPTASNCNYLEVMKYEFDPEMKRLRLVFDLPNYDRTLPPMSVNLTAVGSGPVRNQGPTVNVSDPYGYYGPTAGASSSRRARTSGTFIAPGVGKRVVRAHSSRRGIMERRTSVWASRGSLPYLPFAGHSRQ